MPNTAVIQVNITFKNTEATDALRSYAEEKVRHCLEKFVHKNTDANLVLRVEKKRQIAEISFHADGGDFRVSEESEDLYASIDALTTKLGSQLRKHKERLTDHHCEK